MTGSFDGYRRRQSKTSREGRPAKALPRPAFGRAPGTRPRLTADRSSPSGPELAVGVAQALAERSRGCEPSEGIKGAQATAARGPPRPDGVRKDEIRDFIERKFGYDLSRRSIQSYPLHPSTSLPGAASPRPSRVPWNRTTTSHAVRWRSPSAAIPTRSPQSRRDRPGRIIRDIPPVREQPWLCSMIDARGR